MKILKIWKRTSEIRYYQYLKKQYLDLLSKYEELEYFPKIIERRNYAVELDSTSELKYNFGHTISELKKAMGKPDFQHKFWLLTDYDIVIYDRKIAGIRMIFEFHFFKNELFFFNKSFPCNYFWTNDEMEFLEMFCLKYGITDSQSVTELLICDPNNNSIFVEVKNRLTICNLAHNSKTFQEIIDAIEKKILLQKLKDANRQLAS